MPVQTDNLVPIIHVSHDHNLRTDGKSSGGLHELDVALQDVSRSQAGTPPNGTKTPKSENQMDVVMRRMAALEAEVKQLRSKSSGSQSPADAADNFLSPPTRARSFSGSNSAGLYTVPTTLPDLTGSGPDTPRRGRHNSETSSLSGSRRDPSPGEIIERAVEEDRLSKLSPEKAAKERFGQEFSNYAAYGASGVLAPAQAADQNLKLWSHDGNFAAIGASLPKVKRDKLWATGSVILGGALVAAGYVTNYLKDGLPEKIIRAAELNAGAAYTAGIVLCGTGIASAYSLRKTGRHSVKYLGKAVEKDAISPLAFHAIKKEKNDLAGKAVMYELLKLSAPETVHGEFSEDIEPVDVSHIEKMARIEAASCTPKKLENTRKSAAERIKNHILTFARKNPTVRMKISHEKEFEFDILHPYSQEGEMV